MAKKGAKIGNWANLDLLRENRTGIPEIVLCEGKRKEHVIEIADRLLNENGSAIITRTDKIAQSALAALATKRRASIDINEHARVVVLRKRWKRPTLNGGHVVIIGAGTADHDVGEEARVVAEELGCEVRTAYDIGVAGVHRLVEFLEANINKVTDVYIVVAGREGTLPTLVAGLVDVPVIGVPVSTGYGKGGKGEAALMTMLQSCTPLTVVNIDAGCIAGAAAAQIASRMGRARKKG